MNFINIKSSNNILQISANVISLSRGFAAIPLLILLLNNKMPFAWVIFFIGGISDMADGFLARKAGNGSPWGAKVDPLTDKIFILAPLIWFVQQQILPVWSIWLLISRELIVSSWRSNLKSGGKASKSGKIKTVVQFISICMLLWPKGWGSSYVTTLINLVGWYLFWPSLVIAIISGIKYLSFTNQVESNLS